MPRYPFDPSKIGAYKRSYDEYSEENHNPDQTKELSEVLDWKESLPANKHTNLNLKEHVVAAVETGLGMAGLPGGKSGPGVSLVDPVVNVMQDLYYSARDLISGRRIKTSLIIIGGIAIGAVAGALIGTLVMPGIGSAVGGAMGAAAIGTFLTVGGTVGLSVLGAAGGSWLGAKISNLVFKNEKRYELSHRRTRRIKKYLGIKSEDAEIINGYLINRRLSITSTKGKRSYKLLKDGLIETPENKDQLDEAIKFFTHELKLLERERGLKGQPIPDELDQEIQSVIYILKVIIHSKEFDFRREEELNSILQKYDGSNPANPASSPAPAPAPAPAPVKPVLSTKSHLIQSNDKQMFAVYKRELTEKNKESVSDALAAEALAYSQATGNKSPTVMAGGDDVIATRLLAAAIKAGLTPRLDETEFPDDARRFQLLEQAYKIAGKVIPVSQSTRVGFRPPT